MKLKNYLIVVNDISASEKFYEELFGLKVLMDNNGNLVMTDGLVLQERKYWSEFINNNILFENNALVTVIFEEVIFRGFVYENTCKNEKYKYIVSSILFGIWHLGYIDTVLYRTSIFNPNADILKIMFWKVITGMILGFKFGSL